MATCISTGVSSESAPQNARVVAKVENARRSPSISKRPTPRLQSTRSAALPSVASVSV